MTFRVIVGYEYPVEHKPPVRAELILHGDRVVTDNIELLEQEPRKGHWIIEGEVGNGNRYCRCSECGHGDEQAITQVVPYCWWCGAKMETEDA